MQAVGGVQLLAAHAAAFQQIRIVFVAIFADPLLDDRPRLADPAAVEDQPMFVPKVAEHRGAAQPGGAARAVHPHPLFEFRGQGVEGRRLAVTPPEPAQPFDGGGLAETADESAQTLGDGGIVRPRRAHHRVKGGELRLFRQAAVEQETAERPRQTAVARQPRQQRQGQPPRRDLDVRGEGGRQAGVPLRSQQVGQRLHGGVAPVALHAGQQASERGGEKTGGAGAVVFAGDDRQGAPGLGVRLRPGQEVEQEDKNVVVGVANAAKEIEAVDLAQVGFIGAGGQRDGALGADEQGLGRVRGYKVMRVVFIAFWHGCVGSKAAAFHGEA